MGRHGGGSCSGGRSGGSSRRSSGGSRRSGSSGHSVRYSKRPFHHCYNRSWIDRHGRTHAYYTSDAAYGTRPPNWTAVKFISIALVIHMCFMLWGLAPQVFEFGGKVNGDPSRIMIHDEIDIMDARSEARTMQLFERIYAKSGMPVALFTTDFSWQEYYDSIEILSEDLYYQLSMDEDAMVIVFSADDTDNFAYWEYDMYCGDLTTKCLSDRLFDELLDNFQKALYHSNLTEALEHAWESVMNDMGRTTINWFMMPVLLAVLGFYAIFIGTGIAGAIRQQRAYEYFTENPGALSRTMMSDAELTDAGVEIKPRIKTF